MGKQDVGELRLALCGVESGEVDASVGKGLVGGRKQRKRPFALQCFEQVCLNHRSDQRVMDARALSRSRDVVGGVGGHEHLVNDVNDAVAGHHVSRGHRGTVDHDGIANGEGEAVAVGRLCRHAVRHIGSRHRGSDHVSEEDITQRGHAVGGVKRSEVNASVGKGLVGRGKERERPFTLQGGEQIGLHHGGDQ